MDINERFQRKNAKVTEHHQTKLVERKYIEIMDKKTGETRLQGLRKEKPKNTILSEKRNLWWKLFREQKNKCGICGEELIHRKQTHIDHCHKTGTTRGLLCHNCNVGLGHFKDNQKLLELAWSYLEKHKTVTLI